MKNLLKFGFFALAISLTVASCASNKSESTSDSTVVDSTIVDTTAVDTVLDTVAVVDTAAKM